MKRFLIVLYCLFVVAISSHAQFLIFKAGGSLANIGSTIEAKNKPGIVAGLAFEIPLSTRFSIQPELLFHQKGFKEEGIIYSYGSGYNSTYDYKDSYTYNYLELPILFKYKIGNFYVNVGPSFSYGIGGHYSKTADYNNNGMLSTNTGKIKFGRSSLTYSGGDLYRANAFDLGLQIGGGVKVFKRIIIDLRYGLGLSSTTHKNDIVSFKKDNSYNRSLQLTVGYPIRLGKR